MEFVCFTFNNIYHQCQNRGQIKGKDVFACVTSIYAVCRVLFASNVLKDVSDLQKGFPFFPFLSWFRVFSFYFS